MLGAIKCVTFSAKDNDETERIYGRYLGYKRVADGRVSESLARSWGAPKAAGQRQLILQPESGESTYLRFVEGGAMPDYKPLTTIGWNAAEFIVEDVLALNDRLQASPFQIIGPPEPLKLGDTEMIVAMQVLGPSDEVLYLTQIKSPVPGFDLPKACSFVGRVFITVVGGPSHDPMLGFFNKAFGLPPGPTMSGVVGVLNRALRMPADHQTSLTTVLLADQCVIEIDALPTKAVKRARRDGHLPPAVAMTSFAHDDLDAIGAPFLAPPQSHEGPPYFGARTATLIGGVGELIEIIESGSTRAMSNHV